MNQIGLQHCRLVIRISSYWSNIFGMLFIYSMDEAWQIYQQHAPVVVDLVYNIAWVLKKGGFIYIRQNYVRDLTANILSEVCKDIEIKPELTTLMGKEFGRRTANTTNDTRLDIRLRKIWQRGQQTFLDLRVFDPNASQYLNKLLQQCHIMNEEKGKSIQRESSTNWTWYIYTNGFFNLWKYGKEISYVLFKIIWFIIREMSSTKSITMNWIQTKIYFALLK